MRRPAFLHLVVPAAVLVLSAGCGSDESAGDDQPWRVTADSSGDTIRVRISGDVPERSVRSLVPELRVGALDGSEAETFGRIENVFGTADGGLVVYDGQAQALRRFDASGAHVRRIGGAGGGPGEHGHVNGITRLADGRWALWDAPGARVNFYAAAGEFLTSVSLPITGWFMQDGLHADGSGLLYAWAMLERKPNSFTVSKAGYVRFDSAAVLRDTLVFPDWDVEEATLTASSADGRSATASSVPWAPGSLAAFHPAGGIVSTPGTVSYVWYRLVPGSKPLRVERSHTPVPVSSTEASERRAQIERTMRRLSPSWNWTGPEIPASKPAIRGLTSGHDGRVWVRLYTPAEPIPEEELAPVRDGPNPPIRLTTREPELWDVFSVDGRLLARVRPPARTRLLSFDGNHAWGVQSDSLDVPYAVRFRIEPALPPE